VLFDLGYVSTPEPFQRLVNQGLIMGEMQYYAFAPASGTSGGFVSSEWATDIQEIALVLMANDKRTGERLMASPLNKAEQEIEKRGEHLYIKGGDIRVEARTFKMSKSRGNVVNPDDVVAEYGADALRCYEMFMGPLEQSKPWSMTGVEGVSRFLARVWRLAMEENQAGEWVISNTIQDVAPDKAQLKVIHATIKKVGHDIEALSFNTAIAQMMIFVNGFTHANPRPRSALRTLLQVLNPFAPHLTEELWERLGFSEGGSRPLAVEPWPAYDETLLIEDEVEIVLQINGKVRDKIVVKKEATREEVEAAARASSKIAEWTAGKEIKKVVVVPGKIVNIVVAG
jgi:leucyl-tRNA synthetase